MNSTDSRPSIEVTRFTRPREIRLPKPDQFGCVGFTSYGSIKRGAEVLHVRNPDFDWANARLNPESVR